MNHRWLPFIVGLLVLALGASTAVIASSHHRNGHLFGMAVVPEAAVRDALQVSANGLQQFEVLADQPWGLRKRIVVYRYIVQPSGQPPHREFGMMLVEMRAGWSAEPGPGALLAEADVPAVVSYSSNQIDNTSVVYGIIRDPRVRMLEVSFDSGMTRHVQLKNDGFLITVNGTSALREVKAFDSSGNLLQTQATPQLNEPAFWR